MPDNPLEEGQPAQAQPAPGAPAQAQPAPGKPVQAKPAPGKPVQPKVVQSIVVTETEDDTLDVESFSEQGWQRALDQRRLQQQDTMIKAMIKIFKWLNGGVIGFVVAAWIGGFFGAQHIITEHVVMSLIGATIIQAGIAFIAITKYLFPSNETEKKAKSPRPQRGR